MKKIYFSISIVILFCTTFNTFSQCSVCTVTISSTDATNIAVPLGTTLCITPTGKATGLIAVSGGTMCNEGQIISTNVAVSNGGQFYNNNQSNITNLLIIDNNSKLTNLGSLTMDKFAVADGADATNSGFIDVNTMGDSIGNFTNNGNLTINYDFGNAYTSTFTNNAYFNCKRDFYNSFSSIFYANCMANVDRDFYNSASMYGPATGSCGGFNITGTSYNSATIGSSTTHIDICDASHPVTSVDYNSGTIASTTTNCICTNTCNMLLDLNEKTENQFIHSIYPNPTSDFITFQFSMKESKLLSLEVVDLLGKTVKLKNINPTVGNNTINIDLSDLSQGIYSLRLHDSHNIYVTEKISLLK